MATKLLTPLGGGVTLDAANTATDKTLTLPARTGNVAVDGPTFFAYQTSSQSFSNSTFTKVQYNTELFDTNNNFDKDTNYRFTATVAGYYQFNANVAFNGASAGYVQGLLYKNGSPIIDGSGLANNTTIGGKANAAGVIYLAVSDYVEFYAWQNSGGAVSLQGGSGANTFSASMVRAA